METSDVVTAGQETRGEDIWDISSWVNDLPDKVTFLQNFLSRSEFPQPCKQVLDLLDTYFEQSLLALCHTHAQLRNSDITLLLVREFIFNESKVYGKMLSALEEFQLLELLCSHFSQQPSSEICYCVFDTLFGGLTSPSVKNENQVYRFQLLKKLVSIAIGMQCSAVLDCIAVWMQKHRFCPKLVLELSSSIIEDYYELVPSSLLLVQDISVKSRLLVCQLMTTFSSIFTVTGQTADPFKASLPPCPILSVVADWVSTDPSLCLMTAPITLSSLPSTHTAKTPTSPACPLPISTCPIFGLTRWCTLAPLVLSGDKDVPLKGLRPVMSQLHFGVLQSLLDARRQLEIKGDEIEPGELPEGLDLHNILSVSELATLSKDLAGMISSLDHCKEGCQTAVDLALDRFAQVIQVAMATGSLKCTREDLHKLCECLPTNRLLGVVLTKRTVDLAE